MKWIIDTEELLFGPTLPIAFTNFIRPASGQRYGTWRHLELWRILPVEIAYPSEPVETARLRTFFTMISMQNP